MTHPAVRAEARAQSCRMQTTAAWGRGRRCQTFRGSDMPQATCSIDGCEKQVASRGWCQMHYTRWLRHDDPLFTMYGKEKVCSVEGCGPTHRLSHGFCPKHLYRWQTYGDPLREPEALVWPQTLLQRIDPQPNGCWLWTGREIRAGYGVVSIGNQRSDMAYRAAYNLMVGPIPEGHDLDHLCHNADPYCLGGDWCLHRLCVNPDHLEPVTRSENSRRMVEWLNSRVWCRNAHRWRPETSYITARGTRRCRRCDDLTKERKRLRAAANG